MAHFGIQTSPLTEQLHIGLIDPNGSRVLDGDDIVDLDQDGELRPGMEEYLSGLRHEDHTDRTLRVVADHILEHFGGALGIDYKDGTRYEITVRTTATAAAAGGESSPLDVSVSGDLS